MRSPRIVICGQKDDPFARVSKEMLDDPNVSWRAKGILAYLLGKPKDWKARVKDLENHGKEGRDAVRNALNELRKAGYALLSDIRDEAGRLVEWIWTLSDEPIFHPLPEKPEVGIQYLTKKEGTEIESKETKESSAVADVGTLDDFEPKWIQDDSTKEEKLQRIRRPRLYPSEREFNDFILSYSLDLLNGARPDMYRELCLQKWHQWNKTARKWVKIRDWQEFLLAFERKLTPAW